MLNVTLTSSLWKKLKDFYENTVCNKTFLYEAYQHEVKERGSIAEHLNETQSVVNKLASIKMILDDEFQFYYCLARH